MSCHFSCENKYEWSEFEVKVSKLEEGEPNLGTAYDQFHDAMQNVFRFSCSKLKSDV